MSSSSGSNCILNGSGKSVNVCVCVCTHDKGEGEVFAPGKEIPGEGG